MPLLEIDHRKQIEPKDEVWRDMFMCGFPNALVALYGTGKTALLSGLCYQASKPKGGGLLSKSVMHTSSVYLNYDSPADGYTLRYWLEKHAQTDPGGNLDLITVLEPDNYTLTLGEKELGQLKEIVRQKQARLLIVDSWGACFPHLKQNASEEVATPMLLFRRFAHEENICVVVVDHQGKPQIGENHVLRGPTGSVFKSNQYRVVHILQRVPHKDVQGRHVVRWDVQKHSYKKLPEPFAIELDFKQGVFFTLTDLPNSFGETLLEKAVRVVRTHLEQNPNTEQKRQDLLDIAIKQANVGESTAKKALSVLLSTYDDVHTVSSVGQGNPKAYKLVTEDENPESDDPSNQNPKPPKDHTLSDKSFGYTDLTKTPVSNQNIARLKAKLEREDCPIPSAKKLREYIFLSEIGDEEATETVMAWLEQPEVAAWLEGN